MSYEAWPSPDSPRGPLPRIEDLPVAEQGYDQESVRAAFDAFYRHAAQLDASLKALEAVEVFRRDAMELRSDLRSLRALGFGGGEPQWTAAAWTYERPRREVPPAVPRLAAEAALVVAVAVIAGVAHLQAWVIVTLMAAAWAIVAMSEWLAARARYAVPASVYEPLVVEEALEPAPYVETPPPDAGVGWSAFEEREEVEELTMVEPAPEPEAEAEPEPELREEAEPEPAEAEAEPEPEQPRKRGRFRRRHAESAEPEVEAAAAEPPKHVRVLGANGAETDPWERGFDGDEPESEPAVEPDADGEPEPAGLGRIKRRRR
jgi:hypothetical protein